MRLTVNDRWMYKREPITKAELQGIIHQDEFINVAKAILPSDKMTFLELGCAPGNFAAAFCHDRPWAPVGIDYSADAELFVTTLAQFGKRPQLHVFDLFEDRLDETFDMVCSFGLIEHFRGEMFERLIDIHDSYVRPGGHLVVVMPNFTGYQYFWHYLFDRPDLDNHNIDVMQPAVLSCLLGERYETLFLDYVGVMRLWGNSSFTDTWLGGKAVAGIAKGLSAVLRGMSKIGLGLRGRSFSPYILYVGRKACGGATG